MSMQYKTEDFAAAQAVPFAGNAATGSAAAPSLQFWHGASGNRYIHTVFELIGCPRLPACTYVLVRRDAKGNRQALRIGTVAAEAWSLNLAEIRHRAAQLGANEVHAHLIAAGEPARMLIAQDLQTAHFAEHAAEPSAPPQHLC